jgi:Holliday junction DNA helicase RuvA
MIASLEGTISYIGEDYLVVSVSGVGFKVFTPVETRKTSELFSQTLLHTYLVVREDALTLYGFSETEERDMFVQLIGVSGIGPKTALNIISSLSLELISKAIILEQPELFGKVVGVGKKTAQNIVLTLQGKLTKTTFGFQNPIKDVDADVISALTGLGYSIIEAQSAVQLIPREAPKDLESRIRIALQQLA